MAIRRLSDADVTELADNPTGEFSTSFLNQWKECDIDEDFPNCLADVYIAGRIAQLGLGGAAAQNQIMTMGLCRYSKCRKRNFGCWTFIRSSF
jgi:hypothetical protein